MAALIAEKEKRFSAYVENANEAIWRIDFAPPISLDAPASRQVQMIFDNGVFSEANNAVARTYGLTRRQEVIDRPLRKFMEQSDPKNVEKVVKFVQKKFRMNNLITYEKVSDGTTSIIVNNIIPSIKDGKVRHIWGASLELSELHNAQQELKRSKTELTAQKKTLEQKNAALKELIAHIELDKKELKDRIMANVEQVIIPSLDKIRLKNGAEAYIEKHRRMARNKLDLANKGINLRTYLNSL